jgi:type VI protein secretion system component VasK
MSIIWWIIAIAVVIVWALSVTDIIRRHLGAKRTAAWLLIVVILPFVGSLLYWAMRKPEPDDLRHAEEAERSRREQAQRKPFDSTFGT